MHNRHVKILEMLQAGKLEIRKVAPKLGVSEMTLRRDLRRLEKEQLLIQVKGGAILRPAIDGKAELPDPLIAVKDRMAEALYERIMPCDTLFLGTGSTVLRFASLIARINAHPMTVITHSLSVASVLFRTSCKVILLGGELRISSLDLAGPAAEKSIEDYHADWLVTGCDSAIARWGFYTSDARLSNLERKSIGIADHTAVITDSGKFGKKSMTRFASPDEIDLLVTDSGISGSNRKNLGKVPSLELLIVPAEKESEVLP